jgi:hypothetical protein
MGAYFIVAGLVIFGVVSDKQATELLAAAIAAKEFGQQYLTPATNAVTPDNLPAKPTTDK